MRGVLGSVNSLNVSGPDSLSLVVRGGLSPSPVEGGEGRSRVGSRHDFGSSGISGQGLRGDRRSRPTAKCLMNPAPLNLLLVVFKNSCLESLNAAAVPNSAPPGKVF